MAEKIVGTFVYEVHGCMRAHNLIGKAYEPSRDFTYGEAPDPDKAGKQANVALLAVIASAGTPFQPEPGFYPYSEMGVMNFADDGTVNAVSRWNISGHYGTYHVHSFKGNYVFDLDLLSKIPPKVGFGAFGDLTQFTGLLTLKLDNSKEPPSPSPPPLVWDYAFAFINDNEALLMAGGRSPRPAVLTGRMWRRSGVRRAH